LAEVSFGEWLKRRRKAEGWTQEQLAQQLNCSTITLRKIESEERRPSAQIVEQLAEVFNVPQTEQTVFLRFARGDWKSAPADVIEEAPWRVSGTVPRSRLPATLAPLIGREQDVAQVRQYLAQTGTRLVTLTGPPGIGKTSLSQRVAADSLSDFADGVFFVGLAPLHDPEFVPSTIGETLRFEGRGKISATELVKAGIADKKMLLVLDNFEHLMEAAPIVPELLIACPHLKILVTSREALRVPGEWIYSVPPLDVPQISQLKEKDFATAHGFSALTLFAERARAVHSDFKLNPENATVVAALCSRLDGLPLAIELIAARVRLMSPQELLSRMDDRFTLYADGRRGMPARQKTLHNAIAWSYDLLTPEEQKLFAYLGVFAGGFSLEAAKQVTGNPEILNGITALLDKSLLQRTLDERGETRFTMLFTIREFALNQLGEMDETAKLRDQHLKYFLNLADQADREIHGPRQVEWLDRLEAEHDNYRTALAWCISSGQTESALHLIEKLWWLWLVRNYFSEARGWFDKVRVSPDITDYPIDYAMALNGMSRIVWHQDEYLTARSLAEESQRICQSLGNEGEMGLAGALSALGMAVFWGDFDVARAEACFKQALAIYQAYDARWEWALSLFRLGVVARHRKDNERSRLFLEESLASFRNLGDAFGLGRAYMEIGRLNFDQGDYQQARKMFEQALVTDRQLRYQFGVTGVLLDLGKLCRVQGDYDQAEVLIEESLSNWREHNFGDDNISPFYLGCIMLYRGDYGKARACYIEYLKISQRHDLQVNIGEGLIGLAAATAGVHQYERAALLAGAGQGVSDTVEYKMPPHDRIEIDPLLQIAREQLGEESFEALAAEGRTMTMKQAVTYALEE
jgi:predicted ATPase/transcriptional regulator with XRE-family HTH domain